MITLLIWLLVLLLVLGVIVWVIQMLPLPPPFGNIAIAIVALIFILILVSALLGDLPLRPIRLQ
jgi:hypothetical protein